MQKWYKTALSPLLCEQVKVFQRLLRESSKWYLRGRIFLTMHSYFCAITSYNWTPPPGWPTQGPSPHLSNFLTPPRFWPSKVVKKFFANFCLVLGFLGFFLGFFLFFWGVLLGFVGFWEFSWGLLVNFEQFLFFLKYFGYYSFSYNLHLIDPLSPLIINPDTPPPVVQARE